VCLRSVILVDAPILDHPLLVPRHQGRVIIAQLMSCKDSTAEVDTAKDDKPARSKGLGTTMVVDQVGSLSCFLLLWFDDLNLEPGCMRYI